MAKPKPAEEPETVADESMLQTSTPDSDPIIYRYIGSAVGGERLLSVPLADIRASLWAELPPWVQRSVKASPLYLETDEVSNG